MDLGLVSKLKSLLLGTESTDSSGKIIKAHPDAGRASGKHRENMTLGNFDSEVQELLSILEKYGYDAYELREGRNTDTPSVNVVAFGRGRVILFQVVLLNAGNSKKKVSDDTDDLEAIIGSTRPVMQSQHFDIDGYLAIKSIPSDKWLYADMNRSYVKFGEDYGDLIQVL